MRPKDVARAVYHTLKDEGPGKTVFAKLNDDDEGAAIMAVKLSLPKNTDKLREYLYGNDAKAIGVLDIFTSSNKIVRLSEPEIFVADRFSIESIQSFISTTMEESLYWKQKNGEFCSMFEYKDKTLYCIRTCVYVEEEY